MKNSEKSMLSKFTKGEKAKCELGELSELEKMKSRWIWLEIIENYRESLETTETHSNSN
jgi:hypothetical protein